MKYQITIVEKLQYRKTITVDVPDHLTEQEFETLLDRAEKRSMNASDVPLVMENWGIITLEQDGIEDYSGPDDAEIEIEEYEELN